MRNLRLLGLVLFVLTFANACGGGGDQIAPTDPSTTQYLVITIDVEAQPTRQDKDHVQRLIYGNFPGLGRAGIVDMMDIADRHRVKLTFFLDVLEEIIYPSEIEAVAHLIVDRGHDLQLHTHPDIMPDDWWRKIGVLRKDPNKFTKADADALFTEAKRIVSTWNIPPFIAYRAGSYRYSQGFVQAMPKAGIAFSYNYNISGVSQRKLHLKNVPMFRWEDDVVEVPISYINNGKSSPIRFDDATYVSTQDVQSAYQLISQFQGQWKSPNPLVMMLHSWSLLDLNTETNFFEYKDSSRLVLFDKFLSSLPSQVQVITATKLSQLVSHQTIPVLDRMNTADVFPK
ncbi:MAG TPA: hypothetical protein PKC97_00755 [Burkholderiaceae bacterium]|nr:hypothetical protein [Burkholderiaceae bacterium]